MSKYIKLSDVQKILNIKINDYPKSWTSNFVEWIMEYINSLPSIDFEKMIKEMIEIRRNYSYTADEWWNISRDRVKVAIQTLQELLNKLP